MFASVRTKLHYGRAYDFFAKKNGKYLFSARALEDSEVLVIRNEAIERELLTNPLFAADFYACYDGSYS
ncbi:hypothetical protein GCM10020331_030390 [Ectobacillus funiculus]